MKSRAEAAPTIPVEVSVDFLLHGVSGRGELIDFDFTFDAVPFDQLKMGEAIGAYDVDIS